MRTVVLLLASVLVAFGCAEKDEEPPVFRDIYLIELSAPGEWTDAGSPVNLTRRDGFDDQPAFTLDGQAVLYASRDGTQSDIYRYDLAGGTRTRLTETPEREYIPIPLVGGGFSAVRVDDEWNMQLWRFDEAGGSPERLLPAENEVHYYAWADEDTLALHLFDWRPRLKLVELTGDDEGEILAENIGRCMRPLPGSGVLGFVGKQTEDEWWIKVIDLETLQTRRLVRTLPGQEDFAWTPEGALLMAHGSRLFRWREGQGRSWEDWEQIADFSSVGLNRISRIVVNAPGDRVLLVSERAPGDPGA